MGGIRPFCRHDIPQVAELHALIFGYREKLYRQKIEPSTIRSYYQRIFLESPWDDGDLRSLVYEDKGKVRGFLGVVPRPMLLGGRPIRAAVTSQFMVHPEARSGLAAVELLRAGLSGPQDLALTDGANEYTRKLWLMLGGDIATLYSIHWTRFLRPVRAVLHQLGKKRWYFRPLARVLGPPASLVDGTLHRAFPAQFGHASPAGSRESLDLETLVSSTEEFSQDDLLRPVYDERSLEWLLELASQKLRGCVLRQAIVRDAEGRKAGWYIYYPVRGGLGQVLHMGARAGTIQLVLRHLFEDAWQQGVLGVSGRLSPRFMPEFCESRCFFHCGNPWLLFHSRDPRLAHAFDRGRAFLTRLDGEWWMPFTFV